MKSATVLILGIIKVVAKKSNAEFMRSVPRELVPPEGAGR
jgi:hypothetical protein